MVIFRFFSVFSSAWPHSIQKNSGLCYCLAIDLTSLTLLAMLLATFVARCWVIIISYPTAPSRQSYEHAFITVFCQSFGHKTS